MNQNKQVELLLFRYNLDSGLILNEATAALLCSVKDRKHWDLSARREGVKRGKGESSL